MFTHQGTIIDAHGIEHTNPVFVVRHANLSQSSSLNAHYRFDTNEYDSGEHKRCSINYSMSMWANQKAFDDGKRPLAFVNHDGNENFSIDSVENCTTMEELLSAVEDHFANQVLTDHISEGE